MKIFFRITAATIAAVLLISSCSDEDSENQQEKIEVAFDTWIALNINKNGVERAEKHKTGMYIEWLEKAPAGAQKPITGDWVMINYRGMNIEDYDADKNSGDIFMTRYREDAIKFVEEWIDTSYTHFVPHYLQLSNSAGLMYGQYTALEMMKKGDKVRLYLTPELTEGGYYLTYNNGYGGNGTYPNGEKYAIVEMELVDIIDEPLRREEIIVRDYAVNKWNMQENDTIKKNFYLQVTSPSTEGGVVLHQDSIISMNVTGRFAEDDFVFETTVDSVSRATRRINFFEDNRYTSYAYTFQAFKASHIDFMDEAFSDAVRSGLITYGCTFRMVFTSKYGDGNSNQITYSTPPYTIIQPYTPLVYEVTVDEWVAPEEEDEEEE